MIKSDDKKKIGILCAADDEIAPFLPMIDHCVVSEKAMLKFYEGTIEGIDIVALFCGVCKVNAAVATQILIDTYGCNAIINGGTAGGMDESLKIFDTVIASESAYWDVNEDILSQFHPWLETIYFPTDKGMLDSAKKVVSHMTDHAGKIVFGRMITGEAFIQEEKRAEINARHSPLSVDMETASIAHVCHVNQIPYLAIRTITDTAAHSGFNEFEKNCKKASQISANIVKAVLKEL